ncbi:MAG TPA: STAS domain-containing protein [Spirochaetota bacterium]|nr:STAS domain-containing protein [Spirochaetota bacterium]
MGPRLEYSIEERDAARVVHLTGSVTGTNRAAFEALIDDITTKGNCVINLSAVSMLSTSGITALGDVSLSARKKGKRVVLMGMHPSIIRTMEQLDMYDYFIFVDSVEEGLLKIRHYT